MKVGIILAPFGEARPSGLSAYVLNLTLELLRQNTNWQFLICIKGVYDTSVFDGYENVTIQNFPNSFLWKDIAAFQNRDVDIWLYNNPNMPLLFKPKRSIVTALDFGAFYPDEELSIKERINRLVSKLLQYDALRSTSQVVCTSYATKNDVHTFFPSIEEKKVSVAMCGFTRICEKYTPASIENLPADYYLLVGVIKPRKNQLTVVEAFIEAKKKGLKSKLVICGKGSNEYFATVMETVNNSDCKDDIIYFGYCTNEELVTLFIHARALVFPSHVEGFGMPIVEAMSCGTPVICSSNGALGEVAEGYALTVDSRDTKGFGNAMLTLEDDTIRDSYIAKGKIRASEFSWEKSAQTYAQTMRAVCREN